MFICIKERKEIINLDFVESIICGNECIGNDDKIEYYTICFVCKEAELAQMFFTKEKERDKYFSYIVESMIEGKKIIII